jgi:hypothetical protein
MTHKIVTGPDGKMYTENQTPTNVAEKLQKTRKELRDMIAGNTQFHKDELGKDDPKVEKVEELPYEWYHYMNG